MPVLRNSQRSVRASPGLFDSFAGYNEPNEAVTEQVLIRPVLELLGWTEYLAQQAAAGNEDIPDHLLFADESAKMSAAGKGKPQDRYADALLVEESKRYGLPLDYRDKDDKIQASSPHGTDPEVPVHCGNHDRRPAFAGVSSQIGAIWRLYDNRARPRASGFFEVDVPAILDDDSEDELRTFFLLFRRRAFTLDEGATTTFVETALAEGRRYEEQVAQDLSGVVFDDVFPKLVTALAEKSEAPLTEVRDAALIFLYRLLFVLYAEDRGLLPVNEARYADYGLRKNVRDDVAQKTVARRTFSDMATVYYDRLASLFRQIGEGDQSIGLPPYNGGLFSAETAPLLETARLADSVVAPIIHGLSHTRGSLSSGPGSGNANGTPRFVNYRDMSVQQLGSIYERLMEQEPTRESDGKNRCPAQSLRPQRQRQLLYTAGARRPDHRPNLETSCGRAPEGVRGQGERVKERPPSAGRASHRTGTTRPSRSGPRPESTRPCHGQRPLPRQRRRFPVRLHRPSGRGCTGDTRVAGRGVRIAAR